MCSVAVQFSDVIENRERFMAKSWERETGTEKREGGMGHAVVGEGRGTDPF